MGAQLRAAVVVKKLSSRAGRNRMVWIDKTHTPSSLRDVERCGSKYGNISQKKTLSRKTLSLDANYANLFRDLNFGSDLR